MERLRVAVLPGRTRSDVQRLYRRDVQPPLDRFGFGQLNLKRIIATTEFDNDRSIRMMERLGMSVARNESGEPPWFQVVGALTNPGADTD